MLLAFHLKVERVQDDAYVAVVLHTCCNRAFQMFTVFS
jgi:hypothetical protein